MPRYLIEIPHSPRVQACTRAVAVFLASGSHLLTHADWGCYDGGHSAWLLVEVDSKDEARHLVRPPSTPRPKSWPGTSSLWSSSLPS